MNKNQLLSVSLLLAMLPLGAFACKVADIQVNNLTVLAGPPGQTNTAGYANIHNAGDTACEIVGASSPIAGEVQLHTVKKVADRYKMEQVKEFIIPAKGDLSLASGGNHLMFMGLKQTLKPDDEHVEVTLKFKNGEEKKFEATVHDMRKEPVGSHTGH